MTVTKKQVDVIDMNPGWEGSMVMLIEILINGNPEGQKYARGEMMRLARAMDQVIAERKAAGK